MFSSNRITFSCIAKPSRNSVVLFAAAIAAFLPASSARAGLIVTLEAPKIQSTQVSGTTVETFDSVNTGRYTSLTSTLGTYTSAGLQIVSPDQYGGANQTRYIAVGAQSGQTSATLTLTGPAAYFGFYWSAGDAQNNLDFYSGNSLLASFSTSTLISFISGQANASQYYGNPNTNQNTGEPYAFVNFFANSGTTFDKIVFRNNGTGSGFESDNHTIRAAAVTTPTGTTVTNLVTGVPEPSTWAMALTAMGFAGFAARRKRRSA